ncbi:MULTISPECIES: sigma-70 family RNA polymerase sigma factor [Saccharibacillus]|uniref:sigma-70 family RNA polymerase sigma factor n=1 Tax=Saccharibacillus TaxID=456492 RepID=UPI001365D74A|nr:sigma-70 family RNA polymerase sigma factor [Saccharibacillus sp. WB 17]
MNSPATRAAFDERVRRAAEGDASAFAELIVAERARMLRVAGYYVRGAADAEDAVQEAICRAFTALPALEHPNYFRTWLIRIVINVSLGLLKSSRRTVATGGAEANTLAAPREETDRRLDLMQALSVLPPKYRTVIRLKYMHDLKLTDIAELLELPLGTVKTYQHKGLTLLREQYRSEIEDRRRARARLENDRAAREETEMELESELESELYGLLHQWRERAQALTQRHFAAAETELAPFIEDAFPRDGAASELLFIRTKPGTDTGISVTLTPDGDLIDYAADPRLYDEAKRQARLKPDELLEIGERFVRDHYPDAFERFNGPEIEDRGDRLFFTFSQQAAGMPLPRSGFWIDLHRAGFVTGFKYFGARAEPALSDGLLTPEQVLEQIDRELELNLHFMTLHEEVHVPGDNRLHLVYMPNPYLTHRSALLPSSQPARPGAGDLPAADIPDPCAGSREPIADFMRRGVRTALPDPADLPETLGIREADYELLREQTTGREKTVVYRRRDEGKPVGEHGGTAESVKPYTLDDYMRERLEGTVKLRFDTVSGRLRGLMNLHEEVGELDLSDDACLELALTLLHAADPLLFPYLRLNASDEPDEPDGPDGSDESEASDVPDGADGPDKSEAAPPARRRTAAFIFSVCKNGVPGFFHQVSINVNRTTGRVTLYMDADLDTAELESLPLVPSLSADEAKRRLLAALEPRLTWATVYPDDDSGEKRDELRYALVDRKSGRGIRLIDAHTGQIVTDKN